MQWLIHASLYMEDLSRSRAFYEALGMELRREIVARGGPVDGARIQFFAFPGDRAEIELLERPPTMRVLTGAAGFRHVACGVDALDEVLERLSGRGTSFADPPVVMHDGTRVCFVRDPDGYELELVEGTERWFQGDVG